MIRLGIYILYFTIMVAAVIEEEWAWAIVLACVVYAMLPRRVT